jgi:hypothetical protein
MLLVLGRDEGFRLGEDLLAVLLFERGRAQVAESDGGLGTVVREQLELDMFAVVGFDVGRIQAR